MKLKYISLNVWHGGKFWDQIIEFLKKEDPDILSIQEAHNSTDSNLPINFRTIVEFKAALGFKYSFYSNEFFKITDYGSVDMGNAILSKFPLTDTGTLYFKDHPREMRSENPADFSKIPRNIQHAKVDLNGTHLDVFNTHGVWGPDGLDNPDRLDMSQKIIEQIKNSENAILSGDFNVNQGTKSMLDIEKYLLNVFKGELVTSFNMRQKPKDSGYKNAVVDFIFISPNIKVLEHYCPDIDISDHLPLVAILEVG